MTLGTLKLTLQKFYRISGGSTQAKGCGLRTLCFRNLPDIYEYSKIREKDNPDALPWDEIAKADYTPWKYAYDLNTLKGMSAERMKGNNSFSLIRQDEEWLSSIQDKVYPLSLTKYRDEQKQVKATVKQIETLSKLPAGNELTVQRFRRMYTNTMTTRTRRTGSSSG